MAKIRSVCWGCGMDFVFQSSQANAYKGAGRFCSRGGRRAVHSGAVKGL